MYNESNNDSSQETENNNQQNNNSNNNENNDSNNTNENEPDTTVPDLSIEPDTMLYPSTLNLTDKKITDYSYIDPNLITNYKIYSAYYSEVYDTIYIAYDYIIESKQTLKAKDLYEIEKHAINYFVSDSNRSEDKNYLKAVRIYPDRLASSCRRGVDDSTANNINGCADYGGKEAIIDLNNITSLEDFYNPKREYTGPLTYIESEPMRDTFAHEYGHVSTFYHMVYKNDENYEDYLKIRLGNNYETIYPHGLPEIYSSSYDYTIQPEEILADDFVELFYDISQKKTNDTYEYELAYNDLRNSLNYYPNIKKLKENQTIYNVLKTYYSKFLDYANRTNYTKPIVISSTNKTINYYESYSHIGNNSNLKTVNSSINVNLIAVGETTINSTKYYRVILSNTFECSLIGSSRSCDKKDVGEKFGYVQANNYTLNNSIKLYKLDRNGDEEITKNNIIPIEDNSTNNLYILPFYDFTYALNTTTSTNYATMYDYLSPSLSSTQTYKVNIFSFGTLIN